MTSIISKNPRISIIMTSYNRKVQTMFTLKTIEKSTYIHETEIIVIDDGSKEEERFDCEHYRTKEENELFDKLNINVIYIKKNMKTWINPCMSYNLGIKYAKGEIIIIQNSEVCHIGDCIKFVIENIQKNDWLVLNCYGLGNFEHNEQLYDNYNNSNSIYEYINKVIDNKKQFIRNYYLNRFDECKIKCPQEANDVMEDLKIVMKTYQDEIGGNSIAAINSKKSLIEGWVNHYEKFFVAYHYFGAIYKSDLVEKMNGGFCEDYANGICWDDNDFIKYLIHNNFRFVTTEFNNEKPFVIHQYHNKSDSLISDEREVFHKINKEIFNKRMDSIGASTSIDINAGFKMPIPILL
jgi:hypothetical protein